MSSNQNSSSWDSVNNTLGLKKVVKVISPINSIKIGSVGPLQKNYEDISEEIINTILNKTKFEELDDITILSDSKILIDSLIKYILDNKREETINLEVITKKIDWIKKSNNYLAEKKELQEIVHSSEHYNKKNFGIVRNSYNFCDNMSECPYYYGKYGQSNSNPKFKKGDGNCNKQHFVYNYVVCDINEIEKYISSIESKNINYIEIDKSLKTIKFVIEHMKNELENKDKKPLSIIAKRNSAVSGLSRKNIILDE